jgi:hypothetical protein
LAPWYKNALDFASGGSFLLSQPEENFLFIKNLFGTNIEKRKTWKIWILFLPLFRKGLRIALKDYLTTVQRLISAAAPMTHKWKFVVGFPYQWWAQGWLGVIIELPGKFELRSFSLLSSKLQ